MSTMLRSRTAKASKNESNKTSFENFVQETNSSHNVDEILTNIYSSVIFKDLHGEFSLGSILTKNLKIQYILEIDTQFYMDLNIKELSSNNIVVLSKSNGNLNLNLMPEFVYIDINDSFKEMMNITKNSEFVI